MHESLFQTIRENAKALAASEANLTKSINDSRDPSGNALDISEKIPETDYTLSDLAVGVSALVSLTENVQAGGQGIALPRSVIEKVATSIFELTSQIDAVSAVVSNVVQAHGGVKAIDKSAFVITAQNNSQHGLPKLIRRCFSDLDAAFVAWHQLRLLTNPPDIQDFGRILQGVSTQQSELGKAIEENIRFGKAIQDDQRKLADVLGQSNNDRSEVGRLLQEAQNDRKSLNEYSAEGTDKIAAIRSTHQEASKLDTTIKEYQASFLKFDEQLKGREEKFVAENVTLESIHLRLNDSEKRIAGITQQAEGMLRGATNAGLAASFSKLQTEINLELSWARYSFYFSIFVLGTLSVPIALYVFPGLQALVTSLTAIDPGVLVPKNSANHTTPEIIAQVAARALLLVPGIWLVRFTSARHERLFRLREHYAYKYSVASSVEGFKKQAPDLEQGIAAATFYELTFNPATRMDANSTETRHPNPVMEYVMKKLGGVEGGKSS